MFHEKAANEDSVAQVTTRTGTVIKWEASARWYPSKDAELQTSNVCNQQYISRVVSRKY